MPTLNKRTGNWHECITINGKKRRGVIKGCTNKGAARDWERKLVKEAFDEKCYGIKKETPILFKDFVDGPYKDRHTQYKKALYKFENILDRLKNFFGDLPMHQITYTLIDEYFRDKSVDAKIGANRDITRLGHIFNSAMLWNNQKSESEEKWLLPSFNPVKGIKKNPETPRDRYLIDGEIKRLLYNSAHEEMHDILMIAFLTGLRKGEIQNISKKDIDFVHNAIILRATKSKSLGSTNRDQAVPICQTVRDVLAKYISRKADKPFDYDFKKAFIKTCENAKITDFHFHDTRHTFATILYMEKVPLYTIARLLRHKVGGEVNVTAIYTAVMSDDLRDAINKLESYFIENVLNSEVKSTSPGHQGRLAQLVRASALHS